MAARSASAPRVLLVYGNQTYPVDQAAQAFADSVLGPGSRDFSFQRFDAAELLKPGGGEPILARVDGFEEACISVPLLTDRYVVRLDHLEAVRLPDRSAQALLKTLEELRVRKMIGGDEHTFVPVDASEPGSVPLSRWVARVTPRSAGGPLLEFAPDAEPIGIVTGGTRQGLRAFLRQRIKTKYAFADETEPVEGAEQTTAGSGAARLHQVLERLLDSLPEGLSIVMTADCSRDTDLSKELVERIRKAGRIDKHVIYADQAPVEWLVTQARQRKVPVSSQTAEVIIARVGNDMGRLVQELDRLALLSLPGQPLSEAMLLEAVHVEAQGSVFTLAEQVAAKDLAGALAVLERFLTDSPHEHPLLIAVLARHFRQLRQVHQADRDGASEAEVAQRLKIHPFIAKRIAAQAGKFTLPELERMQSALADLDVAARRQGAVMRVLLQDFLQRACLGGYKVRSARFV
jgi:DNA polymerase III subunit delta